MYLLFVLLSIFLQLDEGLISAEDTTMPNSFLYFAYGSNLLAQRIHLNNPSAVRRGIGMIKDYQLDFNTYSKRWRGAAATIIKQPGSFVWGAIWELDQEHLSSLDKQEGVLENVYKAQEIDVITPNEDRIVKCRIYEQTTVPIATEIIERLEAKRQPSAVYLNVILQGAKESQLPEEYQQFLTRIPHNGYNGKVEVELPLNLI